MLTSTDKGMRKEKVKFIYHFLILLSQVFILTYNLEAATLTVSSNTGASGEKDIPIAIDLISDPGENVSCFNFDLKFDPLRLSFKEVTIGPQAAEAEKSVSYGQPDPDKVTILVFGLNQYIIENGTVLNFRFNILNNAPIGKAELIITDLSISDQNGNSLQVSAENGSITVEGESPLWPLLYKKMWGSKKAQNLSLLRAFRDEILVDTKLGREYVSLLYTHSLEIFTFLLQDPSSITLVSEVIDELLLSIESLRYNEELEIGHGTINKFESLLDTVEGKASPGLKTAIKRIKKDIGEKRGFKQLRIRIVE